MDNKNKRELLFSVTRNDCIWHYTVGTGTGGQKKQKTSSAVHVSHPPSGARAYAEDSRSQLENRQIAFKKMVETKEFKNWHKIEIAKRMGNYIDIDKVVDESLQPHNLKIEIKKDGKWIEVEDLEDENI